MARRMVEGQLSLLALLEPEKPAEKRPGAFEGPSDDSWEDSLSMMRASELRAVEYVAWVEPEATMGRAHPLYACYAVVRLGDRWAFYRKNPYEYHFMDEFDEEKDARKAYRKALGDERLEYRLKDLTEPARFEPIDLYGKGDGRWASGRYARDHWSYDRVQARLTGKE